MKPPYEITPTILKLITSISEKIGRVNASLLDNPEPQLRKQNKIRTIQSSLQIEGNTLSKEQITAILDNKRVIGPAKDIEEVVNANLVYENLSSYSPFSEKSFLKAHKVLMNNLISDAGKYRSKGVGIINDSKIEHMAPSYKNVPFLMSTLFKYLKDKKELTLIKSCVFHYEMEFIHPFMDGNGRMGRLWQTLILKEEYSIFEYIPFETLISQTQKDYYSSLSKSDKTGKSTPFIEYMLGVINDSIDELLRVNNKPLSSLDRLNYFINSNKSQFTRKDYMNIFKHLSSATASRDLKLGTEKGILVKHGEKNATTYLMKTAHNRVDGSAHK